MPRRELSLGVVFTGNIDSSFLSAIRGLQNGLNNLSNSTRQLATSSQTTVASIGNFRKSIRDLAADIQFLLSVQMKWYGAKAVLFAMFDVPVSAARGIITYAAEIDNARAELLRWSATSGEVTEAMKTHVDAIIQSIRKATTEYAVSFKDLKDSVEEFAGAGIPLTVLNQLVPVIAQLKTSFKEINFGQFSVAMTGAWKALRGQITEATDEADAFRIILEKILRAQAVGIIRPENFAVVLQYLTQIGSMSGFTLDQLLAMSVAITDAGIKAGSASRLTAGFMQSLQSPKGLKALKDLGIAFDENKTLAQNMDSIVTQLIQKLGATGEVSMKAMQWFGQLTSADRAKVFGTYVQNFGIYHGLIKDIANSAGGLKTVSDLMNQPFPQQWIIFKNVVREIGAALVEDGSFLRTFMAHIVDIGKGFLYALDASGKYNENIKKLGTFGRAAYEVMVGIRDAFRDLGVILAPIGAALSIIWDMFKKLVDSVGGLHKVIEILVVYISVRLVGSLIMWAGGLGTVQMAIGNLSRVLALFTLGGLTTFGTTIMMIAIQAIPVLISKLGTLGVVLSGLIVTLGMFSKEFGKWDRVAEEAKMKATMMSTKDLENNLKLKEMALADLQREEDDMKGKPLYDEIGFRRRRIQLDKEIGAYKKILEEKKEIDKGLTPASKKAPPITAPDLPGKKAKAIPQGASLTEITNTLEQVRKAMLAQEKTITDESLKELDNRHKLGLISDENYYAEKLSIVQNFVALEIAELDRSWEIRRALLEKEVMDSSGNDRQLAEAKLELETQQYIQARMALRFKEKGELRDKDFQKAQDFLKDEAETNKYYTDLQLQYLNEYYTAKNAALEEESKNTDFQYSRMEISAEEYYGKIRGYAESEYENTVGLVESTRQIWENYYDQAIELAKEDHDKVLALQRERDLKENEFNNRISESRRNLTSKLNDQNRQQLTDLELIYGESGFAGVMEEYFRQLGEQAKKTGEKVMSIMKAVGDGIKTGLGDALYDIATNGLTNFDKIWDNFWQTLLKSWFQTLADWIVQSIAQWTMWATIVKALQAWAFGAASSGAGVGMGATDVAANVAHGGGKVGSTALQKRDVPSWLFDNAPRLHAGLRPDEYPAVLQRGETVLRRGEEQQPTVDVLINVENKTGKQVQATEGPLKFDGKAYVKNIILELMSTDYGFRGAVKGR